MIHKYVKELINRYPKLAVVQGEIFQAYCLLEECYLHNGKLLVAGNGGSAADAEHISGELMKRFQRPRPINKVFAEKLREIDPILGETLVHNLEQPLTAITLGEHIAMTTAYINDVDGLGVFAQQLYGFGRKGDVFLAITTSGNSKNILNAAVVAKALEIKIIGLTGEGGGEIAHKADVTICVPEQETYLVQEFHLPIYHCLCRMLEERFFGEV